MITEVIEQKNLEHPHLVCVLEFQKVLKRIPNPQIHVSTHIHIWASLFES